VPIIPLLFLDTVNRWHYSAWWKLSPGRNRAVFLAQVQVKGMTMEDLPALKEKVFKAMEAELIKCKS
jgi:1-acyl-sn-glycerol-3-phosphate acyltransferase